MRAPLDLRGLSPRTTRLFAAALGATLLHHIDHVLRFDHSGWPFKPEVTPFTFSLLAYPMIFFAWRGPLRAFWWRWALLATGTGFTLWAHTLIESPRMQFHMWAQNQSLELAEPQAHNLLEVHSRGLGVLAVGISLVLNVLALAATLSMLADGLRGARRRP